MSLDPAHSIIRRLGGVGTVADALGVQRQAVWKWKTPKGRSGGTGGLIPQRHHVAILNLARSKDVALTAADFLPGMDEPARRSA